MSIAASDWLLKSSNQNQLETPKLADDTPNYTWRQFILNPDNPEMLIWFPMVKASLRAMDMTTQFVKDQYGKSLSKWGVSGGSKRGWTAWLTAAVDPERVKLIVPVVCDFLNFRGNFSSSH